MGHYTDRMVSREEQRSQRAARLQEVRMRELMEAAQSLFAERGFSAVTIQSIADAAGIAKGTVYLYFRSKDDVYWEIVRRRLVELHAMSGKAVGQAADTESKVRAFISTRLRYFDEQRDFFRIYVVELGQTLVRPERSRPELAALLRQQVEVLRGVLQEGMAKDEVRPLRAEVTAHALIELVRSRVILRLRGVSSVDREEELEDLLALIWRGIVPPKGEP